MVLDSDSKMLQWHYAVNSERVPHLFFVGLL